MDQPAKHPTVEQLRSFGLGRLAPQLQVEVERHVSECNTCCDVLRTLPDDSLIAELQSARNEGAFADGAPGVEPVVPIELANHARYRVIRTLGSGGMGVVYQAEHRLMERMVALKVIRPALLSHPTAVERFRTEVRAAARLAHPNIVAAHDAEQAGDLHLLVMEYIPGISLARLVEEQGPLPAADACRAIEQAARGLHHAWQQGMVHRDIKPQNLMLAENGVVKILDFGLARLASAQDALASSSEAPPPGIPGSMTATGAVLGTPDYIAPEQAADSSRSDIRADIYSLGCTLYFLLAGETPFAQGSVTEKVAAHRLREPVPLSVRRPDLPRALARIVERMMAKDPAARFATPGEAAEALHPWASPRGPLGARLETLGRRIMPRRRAIRLGVAAGGIAALCALGIWSLWRPVVESALGDKPQKDRQVPVSTGKQPQVLLILAAEDFYYPEYDAVRKALREAGAQVIVASTSREPARPDAQSGGQPVKPDVTLREVNPESIDAAIIVGGQGVGQYFSHNPGGAPLQNLCQALLTAGKPIAAVGMATAVLADNHLLSEGQKATGSPHVRIKTDKAGVVWDDGPVTVDGRIVTARDDQAANALVRELLRLLKAKAP